MSRVLVTGGAGFIGSELCRQLAEQGHEVIALDNLVNGKRENLAGLARQGCKLVVGDVRDTDIVAASMADAEVVFHLACLGVRHSIHSPRENHDVNATATLDLLACARVGGREAVRVRLELGGVRHGAHRADDRGAPDVSDDRVWRLQARRRVLRAGIP